MSARTWILTDVAADRYVESSAVGPAEVDSSPPPFALNKRTLRGGLRDGVDVVELDNGRLKLTLLPTRGLGVWRAECGDVRLGWKSPTVGPVHPRYVPVDEPSGIGWLRGFDEFLVRCGLESNGAPEWDASGKLVHPLHGRIANLPAHYLETRVDAARRELAVVGIVDESRFFGQQLRLKSTLRTTLGTNSFTVTDEITNLASAPGELELLYHINQGPPLAAPGSRFLAPVQTLVPKDLFAGKNIASWQTYPAAATGPETVLFFELIAGPDGGTKVLLHNPSGNQGLALSFDRRQFPLFTLWKNPLPFADGYVTGLEPGVNFPNFRAFERQQGRLPIVKPGHSYRSELALEVADTEQAVHQLHDRVNRLQGSTNPVVHRQPLARLSPAGTK